MKIRDPSNPGYHTVCHLGHSLTPPHQFFLNKIKTLNQTIPKIPYNSKIYYFDRFLLLIIRKLFSIVWHIKSHADTLLLCVQAFPFKGSSMINVSSALLSLLTHPSSAATTCNLGFQRRCPLVCSVWCQGPHSSCCESSSQ